MPTKKLSLKPIEIGWEEWVAFPELNLPAIRAKVDTGAKTSALHVFMVEKIQENGDVKVRFGIHPLPDKPEIEVYCKAHLVDEREIISSNGQVEIRYVIRTLAQFGKKKWPIEITLTDRETMAYRMLIGRSAMENRLVVVPERSFLLGKLSDSAYNHIKPKKTKKKLKIAILSTKTNSYSTDRLRAVIQSRGHQVEIINTVRCYVDLSTHQPNIHYQGELLPRFDTIIPRIGSSITYYGVSILRQFESLGMYCLNRSSAIAHSRDKLLAYQLLGRAEILMPTTVFAHYPGDTKDMIKILGGAPLVIKLLSGQGKGVVLAETNKAAKAVILALRGLKADFLAQEYIKESNNKNFFCIVLGNKVIASIRTETYEDKKKTLPIQRQVSVEISPEEKKLAIKSTRILGLKFATVNFIRTKKGPVLIDVDPTPSLKIIEENTGIDIATMVVDYLEHHARPRLPKRIVGLNI